MDKGIRPACNAKFIELNVQRKQGTLTNTAFRKAVMAFIMEEFGITLASAATHYNHSLLQAKTNTPADVEGLGRPDDKKGGRKPKVKTPPPVVEGAPAPANAATITAAAAAVGLGDLTPPAQTEYEVRKKSDDTVIATGLSFEDAKKLVDRATAQKKAKLYYI